MTSLNTLANNVTKLTNQLKKHVSDKTAEKKFRKELKVPQGTRC